MLWVSLLLPWFEPGRSGFSSLAAADFVLAATALMAIALPLVSAVQVKADLPIVWTTLTVLAAIISFAIVGYRLLDPIGGGREEGLYLALGAALVISVGAWRAMADEGP